MLGDTRKRTRLDGESPSGAAASVNPPGPRVVHEKLPSVVRTNEEHFKAVVQALTGSPKTRAAVAATLPPQLLRQVVAAMEEQSCDSPSTSNSSNSGSTPPQNSASAEVSVGGIEDALADARRH